MPFSKNDRKRNKEKFIKTQKIEIFSGIFGWIVDVFVFISSIEYKSMVLFINKNEANPIPMATAICISNKTVKEKQDKRT